MELKALSRKLRFLSRGVLNYIVYRLRHSNGFDPSNSMVISGSTRSGSTWLAEIVTAVPGTLQIFEPLNERYVGDVQKYGIVPDLYKPKDQIWEEGQLFFKNALSGRVVNPWILSQSSISNVISAKRLVIKFVRGTMLTEWLGNNVTKLPPAVVMRHPCAVISSQLSKGWPTGKKRLLDNEYLLHRPNLRKQCEQLSKPEELLALAWCLRYHSCLSLAKPYPFILICYERLVREGVDELKVLFDAWDLSMTEAIKEQINVPSQTVTGSSNIVEGKDPLAGWKKKLNQEQIKNILNVLGVFGMDFYTEDLEPDYRKLAAFGEKNVMADIRMDFS